MLHIVDFCWLENSALKRALNQSITDDLTYKKQKKFHNMNDLEGKLDFLQRNYWSIVRQQQTLICSIIKSPYPKINLFLVIESNFAVYAFCWDMEINKIGDYKIPKHVTDQNSLEIPIVNMKKMDSEYDFYIKIGNFCYNCKRNQTF